MRKASALVCALVGVFIALGLTPTVTAAVPLRCGDAVTTNVSLTKSLTCSGPGLIVAADGVTIDLNGYSLRGNGTDTGIVLNFDEPSVRQVTITGGRIEGFDVGVSTNFERGVRLHQVTLVANRVGAKTYQGLDVTDSKFVRNDIGLEHDDYPLHVTGSSFRDNRRGIDCTDAELMVTDSFFTHNQKGIDSFLCGVHVNATTFSGGDVGLDAEPLGFRVNIRDSRFMNAGIGMRVTDESPVVIANNRFEDNGASGLVIDTRDANSGRDIHISGNAFWDNGFAPGNHVDASGIPLTSGVWARGGGTFVGNKAISNAGHGIEAYGVTDGGGNTAKYNGTEPQCVGVVCTPQ